MSIACSMPVRFFPSAFLALLGHVSCSPVQDRAAMPPPAASPTAEAAPASGPAAFRFDPARVQPGRLLHYVKSNLDGSKPSLVSMYVASPERIEVYKSEEGLIDSAEVSAEMDWATMSPKALQAGVVREDGSRETRAILRVQEGRLHVEIGEQKQDIQVSNLPFHIFNFDLMSLNVTLPHLVAPQASFSVTFVEPTFGERPGLLEDRGQVHLSYSGMDSVHGVPCRKYALSGPGLQDKGGTLWVNSKDDLLELVETPAANNPGWNSFRLERRAEETMTPEAWETYRKGHVGTGVPAAPGK